jgi:multidrug resistance efflux pump
VRTIRLTGTIEAVNFLAIAAPKLSGPGLGQLVVTKLAGSGQHVKKGDLLVLFDQQQQIKNALDQEATYVDFVQQIKKKKADQATAQAADASALHQAENDMKSAAFEVKRNEILSKIDAEKNNLAYEQAKATYEQLRKTFELKRQSEQGDLKSLEIQRDRARDAMEYARKNTGRLEIHAPIDGIVVLNSIWKGGQMGEVQEGDEVRAGVPFMQIVNPGAMQVRARVNQADVSILRVGQPVRIGLDAYPDLSFPGKIERIAAIGVTSSLSDRVRTFNVLFSISGADARLMPDLSASLDVELERLPDSLLVPRDAVAISGNDHYVLAGGGNSFSRQSVQLRAESDTDAVITGIAAGTRVLDSVNP